MPIHPIFMTPAYRYGSQTPWGGDSLRTVFKKNIPDDRTGEALEVSAIPTLNSVAPDGTTMEELIAKHGSSLMGTKVPLPFPLLLKLLNAKEALSVQVHPGDDYAKQVENKLGKTEAWYILDAQEGAELIYGIRPGVTKEMLKDALEDGEKIKQLLNYVPVKKGETYFIPAGTVHAIGEGIVLYEIQQSSDVTYRFYDWNRMDSQGNKRELHIEKALDVVNLNHKAEVATPKCKCTDENGTFELLLDTTYFALERITNASDYVIAPNTERFSILTALEKGIIAYDGEQLEIASGQTVLLPADGVQVTLSGGCFLHTYPNVNEVSHDE